MIVYLIRHASVPVQDKLGQRDAISLSNSGRAEAARLAERLRKIEFAAIISSPLTRAMETATAIAGGRGIPVMPHPAIREVDIGEWDGKTIAELAALDSWKRFNTFRSGTRAPGGEMMREVQARVVAFLERLEQAHADRRIAVVSHADVIRAAVCHYLGVPLDLSLRIQIQPASVTTIHLSEWGVELAGLNDTGEWAGHSP